MLSGFRDSEEAAGVEGSERGAVGDVVGEVMGGGGVQIT